ncbi:hypothetical protein MHIR_DE00214 [Candidatus Doolittlea endobia]|uniref:Uncharacterized protein n=1 Tax=Candidatus Doolittlea endobia TaxID=1778262 RepID=A0A143WSN2_9ENTR|nr:hypothetical protein MHIR_DE00214 [Candidatus Doolittlea endobia]
MLAVLQSVVRILGIYDMFSPVISDEWAEELSETYEAIYINILFHCISRQYVILNTVGIFNEI